MKKIFLSAAVAALVLFSCTKATNNTTILQQLPAYVVNGVHDVTLMGGNSYMSTASLSLTVQYTDSAQENVSLSLSALPAGLSIDSNWLKNGIPTFTSSLTIYDTATVPAVAGTYPITLTVTGANGGKRTYSFNIKVLPEPSCMGVLAGRYQNCSAVCAGGVYTDSVYADPVVPNRIWLTNVLNMGVHLYANGNCLSSGITIPSQTVGGVTYNGSGSFTQAGSGYRLYLDVYSSATSNYCTINMQ